MSTPYSAENHALYLTTSAGTVFAGQGEADSDFISAEFTNDAVSSVEGAKGDVQDSIRVAKMGTITFTNQWGSDFNDNMNEVFENQKNGSYMLKAEIVRTGPTGNVTVVSATNPKIVKLPSYTLGTNAADRAYVFNVHDMQFTERTAPS